MKTLLLALLLLCTGCSTHADRQFKHNLILDQQMIDNDWRYATNK